MGNDKIWIAVLLSIIFLVNLHDYGLESAFKIVVLFLYAGGVMFVVFGFSSVLSNWEELQDKIKSLIVNSVIVTVSLLYLLWANDPRIKVATLGALVFAFGGYLAVFLLVLFHKK